MKKLLMIILLMMAAGFAYGDGYVEASYYSDFQVYDYTDSTELFYDALFETTVYYDRDFSIFTVGGDVETMMFKSNIGWSFYPVSADYGAFIEAEVADGITIGMEHRCEHPVNPWEGEVNINIDNHASNRFYARINF